MFYLFKNIVSQKKKKKKKKRKYQRRKKNQKSQNQNLSNKSPELIFLQGVLKKYILLLFYITVNCN